MLSTLGLLLLIDMTSYELQLNTFRGPLEKLLELIEKRELDITAISLAAVTDDFVKYVRSLADVPPALLADFISVASQLLLLKSRALLPSLPLTEEEEKEILGLEERLRIYQELRHAFRGISHLWKNGQRLHGRNYLPTIFLRDASQEGHCYPGKTTTLETIESSTANVISLLLRVKEETETIKEKIVRLEDKMIEIVNRLQGLGKTKMHHLAQSGNKSELIVIFLALLHLAREQTIELEQDGQFSDIMVASGKQEISKEDDISENS
ncbi:MAG: segregation/condensation protein A [Anaplasmataceae bacterium]|nr:segregation/condensation protein A [Anaplasmataceae bacterium]